MSTLKCLLDCYCERVLLKTYAISFNSLPIVKFYIFLSSADFFQNLIFQNFLSRIPCRVSNGLDPNQARQNVGPDLGPNCLQMLSAADTSRQRVTQLIRNGEKKSVFFFFFFFFFFFLGGGGGGGVLLQTKSIHLQILITQSKNTGPMNVQLIRVDSISYFSKHQPALLQNSQKLNHSSVSVLHHRFFKLLKVYRMFIF